MKQLNLGVIGLGEIGQAHCGALSDIERAKITAVADINETVLEETSSRLGVKAYTDYRELLRQDDVDAVIIATPDQFHREPCEDASAAGKHILVEKPIAMTAEDSEAIIQAAGKGKVKLMVGFTVRFFPQYIHAKKAVEAGQLGDLISIFARRTNVSSQPDRIKGRTGVMYFLGIHDYDAMRWIVGSEPVSVYCESSSSVASKYPIENETFSIIRFANGVIGGAHMGWHMPTNHPAGFDFKMDITGNKGILNLDMIRQGVTVYSGNGAQYPYLASPLVAEDRSFVDAVLDNSPVPVTGHDGLVAVRMVNAALESIETQLPVKL